MQVPAKEALYRLLDPALKGSLNVLRCARWSSYITSYCECYTLSYDTTWYCIMNISWISHDVISCYIMNIMNVISWVLHYEYRYPVLEDVMLGNVGSYHSIIFISYYTHHIIYIIIGSHHCQLFRRMNVLRCARWSSYIMLYHECYTLSYRIVLYCEYCTVRTTLCWEALIMLGKCRVSHHIIISSSTAGHYISCFFWI
jgi:hypothetical protein